MFSTLVDRPEGWFDLALSWPKGKEMERRREGEKLLSGGEHHGGEPVDDQLIMFYA